MVRRLLNACSMPKNRLARELFVVLLMKAAVIGLAAVFIFGPSERPRIDAAKVEAHLIGVPASASPLRTVAPKTFAPKTSALKTAAPRSIVP